MRWPWQPRPEPTMVALRARRAEDLTAQALAELRALTVELRELNHNVDRLAPPRLREDLPDA